MLRTDFQTGATKQPRPFATLLKLASLFVLLLIPNWLDPEEAYTAVEYSYALLAAFGAAGALGYLAIYFASSLDFPPVFDGVRLSRTPEIAGDTPGEDWPLLVALVFGPVVLLLAGLGGWVYRPTG